MLRGVYSSMVYIMSGCFSACIPEKKYKATS